MFVVHYRDNFGYSSRTRSTKSWLLALFESGKLERSNRESTKPDSNSTSKRSLYMWGGTGSGKTFLMDIFYSTLVQFKNNHPNWEGKVNLKCGI